MQPIIQNWHLTAVFVAYIAILALYALGAAVLPALRRALAAARRRRVLGARVRQPEWKARRLTNGQWIVERRR